MKALTAVGEVMKLVYDHLMQRVTDKLEARPGMGQLEMSQVIEAVEALETEGYSLEFLVDRVDLVVQRLAR